MDRWGIVKTNCRVHSHFPPGARHVYVRATRFTSEQYALIFLSPTYPSDYQRPRLQSPTEQSVTVFRRSVYQTSCNPSLLTPRFKSRKLKKQSSHTFPLSSFPSLVQCAQKRVPK